MTVGDKEAVAAEREAPAEDDCVLGGHGQAMFGKPFGPDASQVPTMPSPLPSATQTSCGRHSEQMVLLQAIQGSRAIIAAEEAMLIEAAVLIAEEDPPVTCAA